MVTHNDDFGKQYAIQFVSLDDIQPSPENDDIYGEVGYDEQMNSLICSIERRGIEEPIIVSADGFIISGHRRYFAACHLELQKVPIRRKDFARKDHLSTWHKTLAEYNPQRIKSVGSLLKEALLSRGNGDSRELLHRFEEKAIQTDVAFYEVSGTKLLKEISEKRQQFLEAVVEVVNSLHKFWPLTIRQIHYNLLNNPPLTLTPKKSKYSTEHYRYKNDKSSYDKLVDLLTPARYAGAIPMIAIDDPTRPKLTFSAYRSLDVFLRNEVNSFLCGYHVSKQKDQPRHIEVLGEKGTLLQILKPVCQKYYVPLSLGRGYSSIPVFREISDRFRSSGRKRMTLIVVSDYDPEGLQLAEDAIRTLRDLWNIPVDYHRVAVVREQIEEFNLASDFNPAKETSSRLNFFIEKTGGTETWELEALPPQYIRDQVSAAIESNMNMEIFQKVCQQEEHDAERLSQIRRQLLETLDL